MALVAFNDLSGSLEKAEQRCQRFDTVETFCAIPFIGWLFGMVFAWLPALLLRNRALSELAGKVNGQINEADPSIAKVVIQAKNFLASQGYRFKPENPLDLRDELITKLKPILGEFLENDQFLDEHLLYWLNLALAKLKSPNFIISENSMRALLGRKGVAKDVLSNLKSYAEGIELIKLALEEFQKSHFLSSQELSDIINLRGQVVNVLKEKLQNIVNEILGEIQDENFVNNLPILLDLVILQIQKPNFIIDVEALNMYRPDENMPQETIDFIKLHLDKIDLLRQALSGFRKNNLLTDMVLISVVGSQFNYQAGGVTYPVSGIIEFICKVKQSIDSYLIDAPFGGDKAALFGYILLISNGDAYEKNIPFIAALMTERPDELARIFSDPRGPIDSLDEWREGQKRALASVAAERVERARKAESDLIAIADVTDSSDENSSGSRSPSGSSDEWRRERVVAQQGPDVYNVVEA